MQDSKVTYEAKVLLKSSPLVDVTYDCSSRFARFERREQRSCILSTTLGGILATTSGSSALVLLRILRGRPTGNEANQRITKRKAVPVFLHTVARMLPRSEVERGAKILPGK